MADSEQSIQVTNSLRPLWDAILAIYKEFAELCERHSLRYCADCGTAIGAVRHKGFIPWDDDFDIQMPRSDYEKFVEIAKSELPPGLAWVDRFNSPSYEHAFGKIVVADKNAVGRIERELGRPLTQGVFVDVFPLDGYPDSTVCRTFRKFQSRSWEIWPILAKLCSMLHLVKNGERIRVLSHRRLADLSERRAKKYPFGATKLCVSIGVSRWFDDKPYPTKFFGNPVKVPFDCSEVPVQEDVDGYLRTLYGDYLKLPPESCRHPAHNGGAPKLWRFGPEQPSQSMITRGALHA